MVDHHRGVYHLQPEINWMNDPNGPVWLGDGLHLFYQYNPLGAQWGNMSWGHAVSDDLIHWKRLPVALRPDQPYDQGGVFSGCCVVKDGKPHILYTGVTPEVQCLAIGDERAERFEKYAGNPILAPEDRALLTGFRDPFAWEEDGQTYMVLGSGYRGGVGTALLYRSGDLKTWESLGELCRGDGSTEDMWECPNFLRFEGGRALLLVSLMGRGEVAAMEGRYQDHVFTPGRAWRYDLGDCFYASNAVRLPDGRQLVFGWLKETVPGRESAGWQGMMSLPREVYLLPDGSVGARPLREMSKLRKKKLFSRKAFSVHSGDNPIKEVHGRHLEVVLQFEPGVCALALELAKSPRGEEKAVLRYDGASDCITVDSSRAGGGQTPVGGGVAGQGVVDLRVFLDGSALEAFIGGRETLSTRLYPVRPDSDGLRLYGEGGVRVHKLEIYELESAYKEDAQ